MRSGPRVPDGFELPGADLPRRHVILPPRDRPRARLSVLDITEYYGPDSGGVRTYLHEKARYVAAHDDLRQVVVLPARHFGVRRADGYRVYRVPGPRIPFQQTYRVLLGATECRRLLAHEQPDIVEIGSAYGAPWLPIRAARQFGLPVAWFFHAHLPRIVAPELEASSSLRRWAMRAMVRYVRAVAARVDAVLVGSESVKRDLIRFGIDHVYVIPLGVDTATFHPRRREARAGTLASFGLPDAPLVLYTGRFTAEKALGDAVAAWAAVRTPGAMLVLAGAGPREAALRRSSGARVHFVPFEADRERLADLYAAADLYLAPGPAETFGLSAHEAMACGTPVLSVNAGAVADAVRQAGAGGTWPLHENGEMVRMVDQLLGESSADRIRAREYIERHHEWPTVFDTLFATYQAIIAGHRA